MSGALLLWYAKVLLPATFPQRTATGTVYLCLASLDPLKTTEAWSEAWSETCSRLDGHQVAALTSLVLRQAIWPYGEKQ